MPRPTLDDLIARLPSGYPNVPYSRIKTYWERWAAEMLSDTYQALKPAVAALDLDVSTGVPVTATFQTFTAWNEDINTERDLLEADSGTGLVTCKLPMIARFSLNMNAQLANNVILIVRINAGTATEIEYTGAAEGSGSGVASNISFSGIIIVDQVPDTISVEVRRSSGSSTITFDDCYLIVEYEPFVAFEVTRA